MKRGHAQLIINRHILGNRAVTIGTAYVFETRRENSMELITEAIEAIGGQVLTITDYVIENRQPYQVGKVFNILAVLPADIDS